MPAFDTGVSEAAMLLRRNGPLTRTDLVECTGLSRSAVNLRIDALRDASLVVERQIATLGRGRPPDQFGFNDDRGRLLVADLGVNRLQASVCDLGGAILAQQVWPADVGQPPQTVLSHVLDCFDTLLDTVGLDRDEILGIGISVPAPVRVESGVSVSPPIMPLWNGYDIPGWFASEFSCPVFLDKDANAMAYGEARTNFLLSEQLLLIKISTGIGSGMVHDGRLFRGSNGAAGDLGHTRAVPPGGRRDVVCKCGNTDCLEAHAGGWAMLRDLQAAGVAVDSHDDLLELIRSGEHNATALVRNAGRLIGMTVATAVNLLNPTVIILAGSMVTAGGDNLVAGVRETVYQRSLPLATAQLAIVPSTLEPNAGMVGLAHLVTDELLHPDHIGALLLPAAA